MKKFTAEGAKDAENEICKDTREDIKDEDLW
jgi:hypothetical protein